MQAIFYTTTILYWKGSVGRPLVVEQVDVVTEMVYKT